MPKINLNLVNYYIRKQETQESAPPAQGSIQETAPVTEPTAASTQETTPPEPSTEATRETEPPDVAAASTQTLSSLAHCQVNSVNLPTASQAPMPTNKTPTKRTPTMAITPPKQTRSHPVGGLKAAQQQQNGTRNCE